MAGIDKRIEALERAYGGPAHEENSEGRARLIEELKARWPEAEEKMAREEAEGNFTRRRALDELKAQVERRMRGGP